MLHYGILWHKVLDVVIYVKKIPPQTPFDHIWAMVWSGARGNIAI